MPVTIVRWVDDDPQPGIIEFSLIDRFDRDWRFLEKVAIPTSDTLDAESSYPQPGTIRCTVVRMMIDQRGEPCIVIDTSKPWFIESIEGASRFEVKADRVTWPVDADRA